ncbi:uncharacterized protein LOC108272889 isoform X2 [Ictalurus punctatus]|uniref:Uncharacterized protein LOC108272889 isoform X2 n=1 Tax=Ictalurus punctatus TaxID=7998 RepID=A0A2D0S376_ICTPU|nr:uncharacterized protein LOC108272889 isoform X2 [Ictalurus punctatus]
METGTISESNTQKKAFTKRKCSKSYFQQEIKKIEDLRSAGLLLINCLLVKVIKNKKLDNLFVHIDEMLHSIFFLGYIYNPKLTPSEFFRKSTIDKLKELFPESSQNLTLELKDELMELFPEPFEKYKSHLPTRTPFSILLNMMEILYGTEDKIKENLQLLLKELKFPYPLHKSGDEYQHYYTLEATVICVCYSETHLQKKYYGASLSCRLRKAKRILIDLSCLKTWHEFVSHAVMSFTSGDRYNGITFPESVKCQAYIRDWNENVYRKRRPCLNCAQLFNLQDADLGSVNHPYGNCAETECLSKLLCDNKDIRENTRMENHTEENLENLRDSTKARVLNDLAEVGIQMNNENFLFYSPMPMPPF